MVLSLSINLSEYISYYDKNVPGPLCLMTDLAIRARQSSIVYLYSLSSASRFFLEGMEICRLTYGQAIVAGQLHSCRRCNSGGVPMF